MPVTHCLWFAPTQWNRCSALAHFFAIPFANRIAWSGFVLYIYSIWWKCLHSWEVINERYANQYQPLSDNNTYISMPHWHWYLCISIISLQWDGAGSWNPFSREKGSEYPALSVPLLLMVSGRSIGLSTNRDQVTHLCVSKPCNHWFG